MKNGFTLIEISIALLIAGLVMTGGLKILNAIQANAGVPETRNAINKIDNALIAYISRQSADPDGKPTQAPVYFGAIQIGNGACDCRYDDGAKYASENMPGFSVTGCNAICTRTAERKLPYADSDGDGIPNDTVTDGGIPWDVLGLTESDTIDYWENPIVYEVNQYTAEDGIHSGGISANAQGYTITSYGPDETEGQYDITLTRYYSELVGILINSGIKVD